MLTKVHKKHNMDTRKIKKVNLKYGTRGKLAKKFNVCNTTVSLAVNGTLNSETAQKIRIAAVEMGGDPVYN